MLVLGRRERQSVTLTVQSLWGPIPIVVSVEDIRSESVRLGFEADRTVEILRTEMTKEGPSPRCGGEGATDSAFNLTTRCGRSEPGDPKERMPDGGIRQATMQSPR